MNIRSSDLVHAGAPLREAAGEEWNMSYRIDDIARALATPMPRRSAIAYLGGIFAGMFLAALPMRAASCTTSKDCPKGQCRNPNTKTCISSSLGTSCGNGSNAVCCTAGTTCCAGGNVALCCTSGQCCGHGPGQGENTICGTKCGTKCCCGGSKCCFQHNLTCDTSGGCSTC